VPKFTGFQRIRELAGDERAGAAARFFWQTVVGNRTWINGGNSIHEHFPEPGEMSEHVTHEGGPETCNTYNMLRLTAALHRERPAAAYLDYYENALFNHILASQAPLVGAGAFVYYTPLRPEFARSYGTDFNSFWCCTGTGMENHARYGEMIYSHDERSLYVNLFVASELKWPEQRLELRQETQFPDESSTTIVLTEAPAEPFTLRIRHPHWLNTNTLAVRINGAAIAAESRPGGFAALTRVWKPGDRVHIELPMRVRVVRQPRTADWLSLFYGPILLAGELGSEGLEQRDFIGSYTPGKALMPLSRAPMFLAGSDDELLDGVRPVPGQPATFRTDGIVKPRDVTLAPFFRVHFQRYAMYWQRSDATRWEERQREIAAAERLELELDARTADRVRVGEQQPEMDHNLRFENSRTGTGAQGRHYREARDGGWFSYELKLPPGGHPVSVQLMFWGKDEEREFDVLVDGAVIASPKLRGGGDDFYRTEYPIPGSGISGKDRAIVRIQSKPGTAAIAIYDVRIVTRAPGDASKP
jgi:hypothetical protein